MKKILGVFLIGLIFSLSSCARCNVCEIDGKENVVCTNSLLDRSKAKSNCKKDDGEWLKVERQ